MAAQVKPQDSGALRWRMSPWDHITPDDPFSIEEQFFLEDPFYFSELNPQDDTILTQNDWISYTEDTHDTLLRPSEVDHGKDVQPSLNGPQNYSKSIRISSSIIPCEDIDDGFHLMNAPPTFAKSSDPSPKPILRSESLSLFSNPPQQQASTSAILPPRNAAIIEHALFSVSSKMPPALKIKNLPPILPISSMLKKSVATFLFSFSNRTDISSAEEQETGINWDAVARKAREQTSDGLKVRNELYAVIEFLASRGQPMDADHLLNWVLSRNFPSQHTPASILPEHSSTSFSTSSLSLTHQAPKKLLFFLTKAHLAAFEIVGMRAPERMLFSKNRRGQRAIAHLQSAIHWFMQIGTPLPIYQDQKCTVMLLSLWLSFRFLTLRTGESPQADSFLALHGLCLQHSSTMRLFQEDPIFKTFFPQTLATAYMNSFQSKTPSPGKSESSTNTIFTSEKIPPKDAPAGSIFVQHGLRSFINPHTTGEVELTQLQESIEQDCISAAHEKLLQIQKTGFVERFNSLAPALMPLVEKWRVTVATKLFHIQETSNVITDDTNVMQAQPLVATLIANVGVDAITDTILSLLLMLGHEGSRHGGSRHAPWWLPSMRAFIFGRLSLELGSRLLNGPFTNLMEWPAAQRVQVGARLLAEALPLLQLEDGSCAFVHSVRRLRVNSLLGMLTMNPKLLLRLGVITGSLPISSSEKVEDSQLANLGTEAINNHLSPSFIKPHLSLANQLTMNAPISLPMVVQPRPWSSWRTGGYLLRRMPCFRMRDDPLQMAQVMMADARGRLTTLLEGLSFLGRTPWRINGRILSVIHTAWQISSQTETPVHTSVMASHANVLLGFDANMQPGDRYSLWCDLHYRLMVANAMASHDAFFLPHNVDFRGRAYPIPTLLSHMGSDICRGLVLFGAQEAAPLGPQGFRWLLVHLANMYGYDKTSFEERIAWTQHHKSQIETCARDPINEHWWMTAEHPWQTLAACIEAAGAWAHPQGPEAFITSIPVQQDGSCNGLQHYAALGRDPLGALHVNLVPGSRPADIYSAVAAAVTQRIRLDAEDLNSNVDKEVNDTSKHPSAFDSTTTQAKDASLTSEKKNLPKTSISAGEIARWILSSESGLPSVITRKIVKQSVMTSVYGVTLYGATLQVHKRLVEVSVLPKLDETTDPNGILARENDRRMRQAARYIASLVLTSLGSMFDRSRRIQAWLTEAVSLVTTSVSREWVSNQFGSKAEQEFVTLPSRSFDGPIDAILAGNRLPFASPSLLHQFMTMKEDAIYPRTLMTWTSPLGFPVVQPYREAEKVSVPTPLQMVTLNVTPDHETPVSIRQQIAAFAPNYIHSLDASHMFMTARRAEARGLAFAAVHDSFWTHPKDIDALHEELRAAFVELHSRPLLQELRSELIERFGTNLIPLQKKKLKLPKEETSRKNKGKTINNYQAKPSKGGHQEGVGDDSICWAPLNISPVPEQGSFALEDVLHSPYFFN